MNACDVTLAQLKLARARLQMETCEKFLAWRNAAHARRREDPGASNAGKIAALRQAYFADVDEFEKTAPPLPAE